MGARVGVEKSTLGASGETPCLGKRPAAAAPAPSSSMHYGAQSVTSNELRPQGCQGSSPEEYLCQGAPMGVGAGSQPAWRTRDERNQMECLGS